MTTTATKVGLVQLGCVKNQVDGEEMLRSEAEEPFEDETSWEGTYEAQMIIPAGRHAIEIKVVSPDPELLRSIVLTGWDVTAK